MWNQIRMLLLHCLCKRLQKYFSRRQKHTTFFKIWALRVNECEFSVFSVMIFMKCTHVCKCEFSVFRVMIFMKCTRDCAAQIYQINRT